MATTAERGQQSGFGLFGELVGHGPGRAYETRSGGKRQPWKVSVLVNRSVFEVEYPDEESARAALAGAENRDPVSLRVYPRVAGPREAADRCFIVYGGERLRADGDAA